MSLGLGHGATVAVYLPMTPDSVCAYLGVLLAGGTVVSVAESFSPAELASRLRISGARAVITQVHSNALMSTQSARTPLPCCQSGPLLLWLLYAPYSSACPVHLHFCTFTLYL